MSTSAFPDNSDKSKDQTVYNKVAKTPPSEPVTGPVIDETNARPKVGRVVQTAAVHRSTPLWKKAKSFIFGSALEFVIHDVLIPAAKEAAADAVSQGIEQRLFGHARSVGRRSGTRPGGLSSNRSTGNFSYDRVSSNTARQAPAQPTMSRRGRQRFDIGEIVIPTRAEATEILELMFNIVNQFEVVTVAELYEMAGITPEFTDRRYGWTNLAGSKAVRVSGGYLLDLPTPEALEN